jgi:hypothetical protein
LGFYGNVPFSDEATTQFFYEGGAGYYSRLGERFSFEAYSFLGRGFFITYDRLTNLENPSDNHGRLNVRFDRYALQSNVGFDLSEKMTICMSLRACQLSYNHPSGNVSYYSDCVRDILKDHKMYILEPAITAKWVKHGALLEAQWGFSNNLTNPNFYQFRTFIGLSVILKFDLLEKKKTTLPGA